GNIGSAAARFVLLSGTSFSDAPQFWGVAKIEANLEFLQQYGIYAQGEATLQINTTDSAKTEKISLERIPGDTIFTVTKTARAGSLPTSLFSSVAVPTEWKTLFSSNNVTLSNDAKVTAIVNRTDFKKWRIDDGGKQYFVELDNRTTTPTLTVRSESQTFNLA